MKKITLSIEDHKFQFFLELIKNLEFVQINENEQVADWFDELTPTQKNNSNISRGD